MVRNSIAPVLMNAGFRSNVIPGSAEATINVRTPYLFQAGTDAGAWRSRGIPVYGIYPYPITADELTRMHGNDERVSAQSLEQGTQMVYRTLVEVAGKK